MNRRKSQTGGRRGGRAAAGAGRPRRNRRAYRPVSRRRDSSAQPWSPAELTAEVASQVPGGQLAGFQGDGDAVPGQGSDEAGGVAGHEDVLFDGRLGGEGDLGNGQPALLERLGLPEPVVPARSFWRAIQRMNASTGRSSPRLTCWKTGWRASRQTLRRSPSISERPQ